MRYEIAYVCAIGTLLAACFVAGHNHLGAAAGLIALSGLFTASAAIALSERRRRFDALVSLIRPLRIAGNRKG